MQLDHIIIAAPNLEEAKQDFFDRSGVMPIDGGSHDSGGTCNALVAFEGRDTYLEIIAPDPKQDITGTRAETFAALAEPTLLHWAVRHSDLNHLSDRAINQGLKSSGSVPMQRAAPDGSTLAWDLCFVAGHDQGGVFPFFIDWGDTQHPGMTSPIVGELTHCTITAPTDSPICRLLDPFPNYASFENGQSALSFGFTSPKGEVSYHQLDPAGF